MTGVKETALNDCTLSEELGAIKKNWWAMLLAGIVFTLGGLTAMAFPFLSSLSITMTLGIVSLVCGAVTIVTSFFAGRWGLFFMQLFYGVAYLVIGGLMVYSPIATNAAITLLIAAFAIAGGFFRCIAAVAMRFPRWGWTMVGGIINIVFGFYIISLFPGVALWLLGLLVGVDLFIAGVSWMLLSFDAKRLPNTIVHEAS
ncbi:HdeD family acid-resistance protein [Fuerstiella marisgermanici]|uniref:Acid-resistance membrane protein n=1 Tax=Fuerstiella marisgermanici TaxID=1891926 RepID=A0A1P8WC16_9PLAN|nr:DUF308 domain-containing protein [Fuerstiella marisgermanici]APZ91584.1 acid-resistance membrane protein [Fuerstiella marisgermanici]